MFTRDSKPPRIDTLIGQHRARAGRRASSPAACTSMAQSRATCAPIRRSELGLSVSETGSIEGSVRGAAT